MLGQDPYHNENQAHGLCFSVRPGVKPPPSLGNIFKELKQDIGFETPNNGYLVTWAKQGILMLNTVPKTVPFKLLIPFALSLSSHSCLSEK